MKHRRAFACSAPQCSDVTCLCSAGSAWAHHRSHAAAGTPGDFAYYLLSLSWSPAYCLSSPGAAECNGPRRYRLHRSRTMAAVRAGLARVLRWAPGSARRGGPRHCGFDACARLGLSRMVGARHLQRFDAGRILCAGAPRLLEHRRSSRAREPDASHRAGARLDQHGVFTRKSRPFGAIDRHRLQRTGRAALAGSSRVFRSRTDAASLLGRCSTRRVQSTAGDHPADSLTPPAAPSNPCCGRPNSQ